MVLLIYSQDEFTCGQKMQSSCQILFKKFVRKSGK